MSGITGRHMIGEYLNTTPKKEAKTWGVMGSGFTEANEEVNAQTDSKKYINDASATGSVKSYEWTKPIVADLIEDEEVIAYLADIGRLMKTGGECETEHVTVHFNKPVSIPLLLEIRHRWEKQAILLPGRIHGLTQTSCCFFSINWIKIISENFLNAMGTNWKGES